jgi:phage terminase large subunit GpA-like protein
MYGPSAIAEWSQPATPPPTLTVSEWADAHRRLPETSAARGGRWRTATAPYLAGIMNAALEPGVRKIAVMKSAQSGGSEAINNVVGYFIEHAPAPILLVHPTASAAEAYSKERLSDMIRTTPALRRVVQDKRISGADGRPESTLSLKMFPGGFLALGGANSPNTFARWSVRLAIGDDADRFPPIVGEEGDPADLLVNRTTTFWDGLTIFVSTPTLRGGRIHALYEASDRRKYFVRCPSCGRQDFITWNEPDHFRVAFDDGDASTVRLQCPEPEQGGCAVRITEASRPALIASGQWRPTATAQEPGLVGFHVPAMLSPWVALAELATKFVTARTRGRESLRVFINTALAEPWEDRTQRVEPHWLWSRRESYGAGVEVPAPACVITAAVDVQQNRVEVLVTAWGPAGERWVIDHGVIPGALLHSATQASLLQVLTGTYAHAAGVPLSIHATCIDSGYATDDVYAFVLAHQQHRIYATKGYAARTGEPIVGKPNDKRSGRNRAVRVYPLNVDDGKAEVMSSLALVPPGPGTMHFPLHVDSVNEEFFAQLCAERRETRHSAAGVATHQVWVKERERNEALDLSVLCLAAFRLLSPRMDQWAEALRRLAAGEERVTPAAAPARPPWVQRWGNR